MTASAKPETEQCESLLTLNQCILNPAPFSFFKSILGCCAFWDSDRGLSGVFAISVRSHCYTHTHTYTYTLVCSTSSVPVYLRILPLTSFPQRAVGVMKVGVVKFPHLTFCNE